MQQPQNQPNSTEQTQTSYFQDKTVNIYCIDHIRNAIEAMKQKSETRGMLGKIVIAEEKRGSREVFIAVGDRQLFHRDILTEALIARDAEKWKNLFAMDSERKIRVLKGACNIGGGQLVIDLRSNSFQIYDKSVDFGYIEQNIERQIEEYLKQNLLLSPISNDPLNLNQDLF